MCVCWGAGVGGVGGGGREHPECGDTGQKNESWPERKGVGLMRFPHASLNGN